MKRITAIVLCTLLLALAGGCARQNANQPQMTPLPTERNLSAYPNWVNLPSLQNDRWANPIPDVVERVSPAVVGLSVLTTRPQDDQLVEGIGTGFFVSADGYVLTNNHVAGNAQAIQVVFADGTKQTGQCVWSDAALDLAVVKVEGGPYPFVTMGDSGTLRVGDDVVAVGTPLTLQFQHTVTSGIVSALRRTLSVPSDNYVAFMEELIQIDASINPGNSGGPLCDMNGSVVGINTLKVTEAEGIGFAIPIEIAAPIVQRIVTEGSYEAPYIGLYVMDAEIARYYGQQVQSGLYVINVDANGPAAALGLKEGDCISAINGQPVDTALALRRMIYSCRAGDTIEIRWKSADSQEHSARVTLTTKPAAA